MSNLTHRLLQLALLSTFAAASTGSVVAAEERHTQKSDKYAKQDDRHDEKRSAREHESSGAMTTLKTSVITVTNRGMMPLTITAEPSVRKTSGPGNFSIIAPSTGTPCTTSLVVAPSGACTIGVQYTSSNNEVSTARLKLTDSGAETPTQETEIRAN